MSSNDPFCGGQRGLDFLDSSLSVWSDQRGVYVFAADTTGGHLHFNGGAGWSETFNGQDDYPPAWLTGFPGGSLIVYGYTLPCGIELVDNGVETCGAATSLVNSVFVANNTLAYAVTHNRLLWYDGNYWKQLGAPLDLSSNARAHAIWASSDTIVVVADESRVFLYRGATTVPEVQADLPSGDYWAAWGFGATDIWTGNYNGQLVHFDGTSWSLAWSASDICGGIQGMWGSQGILYFHTNNAIGVWKDGQARILTSFACSDTVRITSLWGNSPTEVFATIQDRSRDGTTCGQARVVWFNGKEFGTL
jgi:hypothetical protein